LGTSVMAESSSITTVLSLTTAFEHSEVWFESDEFRFGRQHDQLGVE
jgi:hypothetical protein